MKKTLAMCIRCKDENDCLKENIDYHSLIGIEHFFIYDHKSITPLKEELKGYENVTVELVESTLEMEGCYAKCYEENKDKYQWIAFIDTDEFIVMKDGSVDLKDFLKPFEDYGGLAIWWKAFGLSGHKTKQKSVIQSFTGTLAGGGFGGHKWNNYKTILNTQYGSPIYRGKTGTQNAHRCKYHPVKVGNRTIKKYCVDEEFAQIPPRHSNGKVFAFESLDRRESVRTNKIQINHYTTLSEEEFLEKMHRYEWLEVHHELMKKSLEPGGIANFKTKLTLDTTIIDFLDKIKKDKND